MTVEKLNGRHARVKLPKLGWVKFRLTRSLHALVIRSATLTREGRHWFLSLLVNDGIEAPTAHPQPGTGVGVDRGVVVAVATSAGDLLDRAFVTAGERRRRLDFCQKTAHQLAYANAVVVLEKLPVKNMTRRARPVWDPDNPGGFLPNGAAAKSGLNRAILSKGWYQFEVALKSVSRYTGTQVVTVAAAFTSQRCSACGHVDPKSRESQAVFRCTHCSHHEHADVNAAKNVLAAGLAVAACRESVAPAGATETSKQQPAGNREELLLQPLHSAPAA
jgi:putative transposase